MKLAVDLKIMCIAMQYRCIGEYEPAIKEQDKTCITHCDSFRLDPPDKIGTDFVNIVIHERARSAVTAVVERYGNIFE